MDYGRAALVYKTEGMDGELEGSDSEGKKFRRRERRALDIFSTTTTLRHAQGAFTDLPKWPWLPTRHLEMSDSAPRFIAQAT